MDNYRPISLLNTFSKIMEKIVASRLTFFLEGNNILSKWQFGFRAGHSTSHPMVHFLNKITDALNKKKHAVAIIIFSKLSKYGILGIELEWFKSYLKNRKQFVSIKNKSSPLLDILLGVPQGSILGPLPLSSKFLALLCSLTTQHYFIRMTIYKSSKKLSTKSFVKSVNTSTTP